ncbi:MAG: hypothetical protein K5793_03755 [Nitrosarchaeum sp.]|nr:hypothetical protein [Nitrosarchaeum sp.]
MSYDKDKTFQPQSLIIHSPDYVENLQRQLAVINFDVAYSNFFPQCELAMKIIYMVEEAIKQKIIDLSKRPDLMLNESSVYRLKRLWDGDCFIGINDRQRDTETFFYDKESIYTCGLEFDEIIPIPALDNMAPIGQLKQKTLLVQITQSIPCCYAWQGMNYAVLVEEGNLKVQTIEGISPLITREDMESTTKYTFLISRDVYHRLMKKMKNKFIIHWSVIYNNIHQIIEYMVKNTEGEKTYEPKSLVGKNDDTFDEDEESE